ncbi:hypothetical protein CK203_004102 [Vitis vinifera]|uniref:GAG-pre-integrase domain-containing protein n=1 Tax=Vitis vinifera TaxID=29760 RepID=A0A438KAE1_VITVI|nr:hypothetical protein CK203_004102 [Vitis vinifera]
MQAYLEAFDLWEVVAEDKPIAPLPANPTLAQIKAHTDEKTKKTTKEALDKLKLEYQGSDITKQMQMLNLKMDFESLTMQEDETTTKYSNRIALIVNKIRSLGEEFPDVRIVEKVLVTLLRDLQEEKLFVVSCFSSQDSYNAWFIDNGCTHHMCHNATIFKDLDKTYNSMVKVGNGGYVDVKGRDAVVVKTNSGIKLISDVLFVPDISQNLLNMKSKNFAINWENAVEYAYVGVTQSVSDLWHKRFGHYNQRSLVELKKLELVENMPKRI